jgi:hypothetical protein
MAIDPSIISQGIRPYVAPDLAAIQGKQLTLANLGMQNQLQGQQLAQEQLNQQQTAQLNDLYKGNVNPDGTINRSGLYGAVAAGGLGSRLPALQKGFADTDKATADAQKVQVEVHKAKVDAVGDRIASLLTNPNVTHDQVIQSISSLVQDGTIDPNTGAGMVQAVPGDQAQLRQWLVQKGMEAHADSARMAQLMPKFVYEDTGKKKVPVDTNSITNPNPTPIALTTTSGQDQTAQIERARMAQEKALQGGAVTYQQDGNGNIIALPTHPGAGGVVGQTAVGPDGKPLQGNKTQLNGDQAKALLFGSRMKVANDILEKQHLAGIDNSGAIYQGVGAIPLVGGAAQQAANFTQSAGQQSVDQAQRDFINAVLRRESGAAISPGEFSSAALQYFPQRGDKPEQIAQKKANRELAMRGILVEVPPSQRDALVPGASGGQGTTQSPGAINFNVDPTIQAILDKHGVK